MKYILLCLGALCICFGAGFVAARMLFRKRKSRAAIGLLTCALGLLFLGAIAFGYLQISYHADASAEAALAGNADVTVTAVDGGYFFDGSGTSSALVFYPGAKVACEAYAPLLLQLAQSGIDCFLTDMPFDFAMFGANRAEKFLNAYTYDNWIMAGHSMGGLVAAGFAASHADKVSALVLLAAYPTSTIPDNVKLLSVYGSEDTCLNAQAYEQGRIHWPEDAAECILAGGNHAQFGNYGAQRGDGTARISAEEQQVRTAAAIADW